MPYFAVYAATKNYVAAFTEALSSECSDSGVVIQVLDPGDVDTRMTQFDPDQPAFMKPTADQFVENAIRSLGFTGRTSGWAAHSFLTSVLPVWIVPQWAVGFILKHHGKEQYQYCKQQVLKNKEAAQE